MFGIIFHHHDQQSRATSKPRPFRAKKYQNPGKNRYE
jgi:hypothetical protein